jgi:hypothetical protein
VASTVDWTVESSAAACAAAGATAQQASTASAINVLEGRRRSGNGCLAPACITPGYAQGPTPLTDRTETSQPSRSDPAQAQEKAAGMQGFM